MVVRQRCLFGLLRLVLQSRAPALKTKAKSNDPPGVRIGRLNTVAGVRREICRLYREARTGAVAIADASKLANILYIAGRLLEGQELEERVRKLEQTARPSLL
jgi:hypothetical protein